MLSGNTAAFAETTSFKSNEEQEGAIVDKRLVWGQRENNR